MTGVQTCALPISQKMDPSRRQKGRGRKIIRRKRRKYGAKSCCKKIKNADPCTDPLDSRKPGPYFFHVHLPPGDLLDQEFKNGVDHQCQRTDSQQDPLHQRLIPVGRRSAKKHSDPRICKNRLHKHRSCHTGNTLDTELSKDLRENIPENIFFFNYILRKI